MKIDWTKDPLDLFDDLPAETDWSDPTHVPCMVADVVYRCGGLAEDLSDAEHVRLCVVALDNMPHGRWIAEATIESELYHLAAVGGWSEYLFDPFTGRFPWDSEGG